MARKSRTRIFSLRNCLRILLRTIVRSNCYGKMIHSIKYSIYKFEDIKLTSTLLKSDIPSDLM